MFLSLVFVISDSTPSVFRGLLVARAKRVLRDEMDRRYGDKTQRLGKEDVPDVHVNIVSMPNYCF